MTRDFKLAPLRRAFAMLLIALVAACAHDGERASPLRFDGLYVSGELEGRPNHRSYIRFYPDGAVVMASVSGASTPQQVSGWLSPTHPWSSAGAYEVRLDRINMSVTGRVPVAGAPETGSFTNTYQGVIRGDELQLDRGGAGEVSIVTYRFAAVSFDG